jgi:predicted RNA-binding Zn ribbon-like protein
MSAASREAGEWVDGFLFVANRPILDLLNTKPVLAGEPTELLPDVQALERWLIASGVVTSARSKGALRNWRGSRRAKAFLDELIGFRERLREAVLRVEAGSAPSDEFLEEVNARLLEYPLRSCLRKRESGQRNGGIVREVLFDPLEPADLWAWIADGVAELLSEVERSRLRKCEACVVHFVDTSKKGSRRWCSMNLCGNKHKVASYQRRKRKGNSG